MKNIQVIDGAINCSYDVYSVSERDFLVIFPAPNQDIEFIEDVVERLGEDEAGKLVMRATSPRKRVEKCRVNGIHGTLFFQLADVKKRFYPNKREKDLDEPSALR